MSERIEVGDLVMVVRWPCCGLHLGKVGTISAIDHIRNIYCTRCGAVDLPMPNADFPNLGKGSLAAAPLAWLRKIPPLTELQERREEVEV